MSSNLELTLLSSLLAVFICVLTVVLQFFCNSVLQFFFQSSLKTETGENQQMLDKCKLPQSSQH